MGVIPPEKVARLLRGLRREADERAIDKATLRAEKRAAERAVIEVRGREIAAWSGDTLMWRAEAPSGPAARVIAQALRDLQESRGSIF